MSIEYLTAVWKDEYYTEKDKTKLLVALAIADCADGNGFAFPGVEYLAKKSRCGTRSVQELCRELEKDGKLEIQSAKGRNGTNLYRLLGVQPLRGSKDSVSVNGVQRLQGATVAGCKVAPLKAPLKAAEEAPPHCTRSVRNHQEPSGTTKNHHRDSVSERGIVFAEWFRTLLPETINLSANWKKDWGKCYDQMIALDSRTPDDISKVCQWARDDSFWNSNFHSPMKLRKPNKDGVHYFDVFFAKANPPAARGQIPPNQVKPPIAFRPMDDFDPETETEG